MFNTSSYLKKTQKTLNYAVWSVDFFLFLMTYSMLFMDLKKAPWTLLRCWWLFGVLIIPVGRRDGLCCCVVCDSKVLIIVRCLCHPLPPAVLILNDQFFYNQFDVFFIIFTIFSDAMHSGRLLIVVNPFWGKVLNQKTNKAQTCSHMNSKDTLN